MAKKEEADSDKEAAAASEEAEAGRRRPSRGRSKRGEKEGAEHGGRGQRKKEEGRVEEPREEGPKPEEHAPIDPHGKAPVAEPEEERREGRERDEEGGAAIHEKEEDRHHIIPKNEPEEKREEDQNLQQKAGGKEKSEYEEERYIPWKKIAIIAAVLIIAAACAFILLSHPAAMQALPTYPVPSIAVSNTVIDAGQSIVFNAIANGNYIPLSYRFIIASTTTGNTFANVLNVNSMTYNSLSYTTRTSDGGNVIVGWVVVSYQQGVVNSTKTAGITVNPKITAANVVATSTNIGRGQSVDLTAFWSGGTPDYMLKWYSGQSATCAQDTSQLSILTNLSATSSSILLTPSGNTYYCYVVIDSANQPASVASQAIQIVVGTGGAASGVPLAQSNATGSQQSAISAISSALCGLVGNVMAIVGALSLTLFLLGGVFYAVSHFLPTSLEFKKSLHTWSTTMIVGAVIALVIVIAARPLLTLIANIGASATGGSALAISC